MESPHFRAHGEYNDTLITIYGEDHGNIDNSIYQELDEEGSLVDKIVMVEHSTLYCGLKDDEEIEQYLSTYKEHYGHLPSGSEYIWFTQVIKGDPVICIDNRLENEFLDRASELNLFNKDVSLEKVMLTVKTIFAALKNIWETVKTIKEPFTPIKSAYVKLKDTCMTQFKTIMKDKEDGKKLDLKVKENLLNNLFKISSLSVDMNIIELIDKYATEKDKKPIFIFVGIAHAMRIQELLNLEIDKTESSVDLTLYETSKLSHVYTGGKKHRRPKTKARRTKAIHKTRRKTINK
jgi:hypothetical protein